METQKLERLVSLKDILKILLKTIINQQYLLILDRKHLSLKVNQKVFLLAYLT